MKTMFVWRIWEKKYPPSRKCLPSVELRVDLSEWVLPFGIEYWRKYDRISIRILCFSLLVESWKFLFPVYYKHYYD